MKAVKHFRTITRHKRLVKQYCFMAGMYKQGLLHDLSKYSPTEFLMGAKYFQGNRSPNNAEKEAKGYSSSWLHHKGRNKHHFEYWIDYSGKPGVILCGMKMPPKYVIEMFFDRIAACRTYQKDKYTDKSPMAYYEKSKAYHIMNPESQALLEQLLMTLSKDGEAKAIDLATKIFKADKAKNGKELFSIRKHKSDYL